MANFGFGTLLTRLTLSCAPSVASNMTGMHFLEEALVVHRASRRCERVRSLFYANSFGFRIVRVVVVVVVVVRSSGLSNAQRGSVA